MADKSTVRHRDMVHRHIEIAASVNYAVGIGPWPMVWIGGLAGWFELHPAAEYTEMYDTVCEGISLYYSVMEVYLEAKAPKKKKDKYPNHPIERVLFKVGIVTTTYTPRSFLLTLISTRSPMETGLPYLKRNRGLTSMLCFSFHSFLRSRTLNGPRRPSSDG